MPWELRIVNAADAAKPLGDRADVIARVAAALPGVELELDPGPPPEWIAQMPPALREHHATRHPKLRADFEGDGFSLQFFADDQSTIHHLAADLRGDGDPRAALSALCVPNGWAVISIPEDKLLNLER